MNKFIYLRFSSYSNRHIGINYAFHYLNIYKDHNLIMDYGSKFDLEKNGIKYLIQNSKKEKMEIVTPNINMLGFKAHYLLKKNECSLQYNDIINNNKKMYFPMD